MTMSPQIARPCVYNNGVTEYAAVITQVLDNGEHVSLVVFPHDKGTFNMPAAVFDIDGERLPNTAYYQRG